MICLWRNPKGEESMTKRKGKGDGIVQLCITVLGSLAFLGILIWILNYRHTHYLEHTKINGVDCTELTADEAKEKIEQEDMVKFRFANGTEVTVYASEAGRSISDTTELEEFLMKQNENGGEEELELTLTKDSFSISETALGKCIEKSMSESKETMSKEPQNAYIQQKSDGYFEIIQEVQGYYLPIKEAQSFAQAILKNGGVEVDFTEISRVKPEITSETKELIEEVENLNKIVGAKIEYTLRDGSTYTLDHEVLKTWVTQTDSGKYTVSIEENIYGFLEGLNEKVQSLGSEMEFTDREGNTTILPVPRLEDRDKVDIDAEKAEVLTSLLKGEEISRKPIYSRFNSQYEFKSWAEVDLTHQLVYLYVDEQTIVNAKPCVTGTANTTRATPKGVYYMFYREPDKDFEKYGGHSDYWMQFTEDGIGFHDAGWRPDSDFVPETYLTRGSHGCINLQKATAKLFYENLTKKMPIIVH